MSTEIATWNTIRSKIPSFPSPTAGRGNECLTKAEIQSLGGLYVSINGNYENSECVMLDNIQAQPITWVYTFSVSPTSLSFPAIRDTQSVSVTSYKRKYIGEIYSGVQESVGFTSSTPDSWLSSTGTSVTAQENTVTSKRSGTIMYTQQESGNPARVEVEQREAVITWDYSVSLSSSHLEYSIKTSNRWEPASTITVKCVKRQWMNGKVVSTTPNAWGMVEKSTDSVRSSVHTTIKLTLAGDNTHYAYVDVDQRGDNELNFGPPLNVFLDNQGWVRADRFIKPYDKENSLEAQNATANFYLVVHNQY